MTEKSQSDKIQNSTWIDLLEPVENCLKDLQLSTENQFMEIGGNMGMFSKEASEISEDSLSVLGLIAGEENLSTLDDILKKIRSIERFISYSITQLEEDVEILGKQRDNFLKFNRPLNKLKKTIIQLNTLSLAIKIETTRLVSDSSGFGILADEVKTLTQNSKNKIEDIGLTGESAVDIIDQLLSSIDDLKGNKYSSMNNLLNVVTANMTNLKEQHSMAAVISEEITELFRENYNSINEIIMNLQFHDIVRQKIEHVIHSIEELNKDLAEGTISEQADPAAFSARVYAFCQLQSEQLKYARREVMTALDKIKDMLRNIKKSVSVTNNKIIEMSHTNSANLQTLIQKGGNTIDQISKTLFETLDSSDESFSTIKLVIKILNKISCHVNDITTIGEDISLISYNGLIKASHLGSEGVVLGVITGEVENMVGETQQSVNTLSDLLSGIDTYIENLKMSVDCEADAGDSREDVDKIVQDLSGFFRSLNDSSEKLNYDLSHLEQKNGEFADKLQLSLEDITVGNDFDFGLTSAIDGLSLIVEKIKSTYGDVDQSAVKDILEEHREKYTMNKEREIHDVFTDGGGEMAEEDELSDNVELF